MDFLIEDTVSAEVVFDLFAGVYDGGVVAAAHFVSYSREGNMKVLAQKVHDDLARLHHLFLSCLFVNTLLFDFVVLCDLLYHFLNRESFCRAGSVL